ncbi:hypothetical protein [Streptomyces sp. NPDC049906]|uniref:hypothetical protein n=1 Tax=Streptomyces sp. NPDC049906 TaxID=3155656 RepID=UPI00344625A3
MTDPKRDISKSPKVVLGSDGTFSPTWLQGKTVAPVPVGQQIDAALARRIAAGCRAVGAPHLLGVSLADDPAAKTGTRLPLPGHEDGTAVRPPFLLTTPDLQGAVLFLEAGYALIAGTTAFMAAAVGEGVDAARARFGRYVRALVEPRPSLSHVAAAHPPRHRAWAHPDDVDPASAAARQLALLDAFAEGSCGAPGFADGWWKARRASQTNGERIQGALGAFFDQVFMILEDYTADPDLAEPGDLDDDGLRAAVQEARKTFHRSESGRTRRHP